MVYFYQRTPTYPWWRVIICKESIHLAIIKKVGNIPRALFFNTNPDENHFSSIYLALALLFVRRRNLIFL